MSSEILYICDNCGHQMVISVDKVDQKRDEYHPCDECETLVAWDEFTVGS